MGEISARVFAAAGIQDKVEAHCVAAGEGPQFMQDVLDGGLEPGTVGMLFLDHEKKGLR